MGKLGMAVLVFFCLCTLTGMRSGAAAGEMASVRLSGYWEEDIVAIAQSLIGYEVRPSGTDALDAENMDWTAGFVSFCVQNAEIPLDLSANTIMELRKNGVRYRSYHTARNHRPEKGDIFFAAEDKKPDSPSYCGIVEQVTQTVIYTIVGDEQAQIVRRVYFKDDPLIYGYISIWDLMRADGILIIEDTLTAEEPLVKETTGKKKEMQELPAAPKEDEYFFLLNPVL